MKKVKKSGDFGQAKEIFKTLKLDKPLIVKVDSVGNFRKYLTEVSGKECKYLTKVLNKEKRELMVIKLK